MSGVTPLARLVDPAAPRAADVKGAAQPAPGDIAASPGEPGAISEARPQAFSLALIEASRLLATQPAPAEPGVLEAPPTDVGEQTADTPADALLQDLRGLDQTAADADAKAPLETGSFAAPSAPDGLAELRATLATPNAPGDASGNAEGAPRALPLDDLRAAQAPAPAQDGATQATRAQEVDAAFRPAAPEFERGDALDRLASQRLASTNGASREAVQDAQPAPNGDGFADSREEGFDSRRQDGQSQFSQAFATTAQTAAALDANAQSARADVGTASPTAAAARSEAEAANGPRALPELPARSENELIREVRLLAQDGGGTARIQLNPPDLGGLNVRVTVSEQGVTVTLLAERMPVAELLGRHMGELRQALEAHGLNVDRFEVDEERSEDATGSRFDAEEWKRGAQGGLDRRGEDAPSSGFLSNGAPLRPRLDLNTLGAVDVRV